MLTPSKRDAINLEPAPTLVIRKGRLWRDVRFSLVYDGELLSASDKHSRLRNKNHIRFELASQLWEIYGAADFSRFQLDRKTTLKAGCEIHDIGFVPLLTREMNASCSLVIKFMRNDKPGRIVHGGDMDNRLKTLFDALRLPEDESEVLPILAGPQIIHEGIKLCPCLLEDDALITDLSVQAVTIMTPLQKNHVRLVIDVEFRPFDFL